MWGGQSRENEYKATTGRPRRGGGLVVPAVDEGQGEEPSGCSKTTGKAGGRSRRGTEGVQGRIQIPKTEGGGGPKNCKSTCGGKKKKSHASGGKRESQGGEGVNLGEEGEPGGKGEQDCN